MSLRSGLAAVAESVPHVEGRLESGAVLVWRLPPSMSQSALGGRPTSSNACTIIALKMAEAVLDLRLSFAPAAVPGRHDRPYPTTRAAARHMDAVKRQASVDAFPCPSQQSHNYLRQGLPKRHWEGPWALVGALANAIVDGNAVHEWTMRFHRRNPTELNFNIPDAISVVKNVFREVDYRTVRGPLGPRLLENIEWVVNWWDSAGSASPLTLLLISYSRTVLLVYQAAERVFGLVDSHAHGLAGPLIAVAARHGLRDLVEWIANHVFAESQNPLRLEEAEFEISIIRYVGGDGEPSPKRRRKAAPQAYDSPPRSVQGPECRGWIFPTRAPVGMGAASGGAESTARRRLEGLSPPPTPTPTPPMPARNGVQARSDYCLRKTSSRTRSPH